MRPLFIIMTLFFMLIAGFAFAQNDMLIEQIAGKTVIRENFDKNSRLIDKQIFRISNIEKSILIRQEFRSMDGSYFTMNYK